MQPVLKPLYETHVAGGNLVFKITAGPFAGVEYTYESLSLNGELKYKLRSKKKQVDDSNRILFESEIRRIIKDKLSKI
jgi:hypothetical protein